MAGSTNNRVQIPEKVEAEILMKCGRRCCLCWALQGNANIKCGQMAHLDHNPQNNDPDNLAFLCFDHHNEYDSKPRQSKGLTRAEVKSYRDALYQAIASQPKPIYQPSPGSDGLTSHAPPTSRDITTITMNGKSNIAAGRDLTIVINQPPKAKQAPLVVPGTVAEDHKKFNYLKYLVGRYNELKEWDCRQQGLQMKHGFIYAAFKRSMKCDLRHTPLSRFDEAVNFLQGRILSTRLGRMEHKKGNPLFETFDQFPG